MNEINVKASRWSRGWELEIDRDHHTQVATLNRARQQVVDYLDSTWEDIDHSEWVINIVPEVDGLTAVHEAREATQRATELQIEAARQSREAARMLRSEGLSVTDVAVIMGVSRGRVSQLTQA